MKRDDARREQIAYYRRKGDAPFKMTASKVRLAMTSMG